MQHQTLLFTPSRTLCCRCTRTTQQKSHTGAPCGHLRAGTGAEASSAANAGHAGIAVCGHHTLPWVFLPHLVVESGRVWCPKQLHQHDSEYHGTAVNCIHDGNGQRQQVALFQCLRAGGLAVCCTPPLADRTSVACILHQTI